jgi:integrase
MAHMLQKAGKEARQNRLTEGRARQLLGELLESVSGVSLKEFTVAEWLEHVAKGKRKSKADKTALRYEQVVREFVAFLGARAKNNVASVSSKDIAEFRDKREAQGLAPGTLNIVIATLSAAFNAALKQGHVSVNPCAAIEPVRDKVTERKQTFTPEQVRTLITRADGNWPGLIRVAFYCGQRLGDCASLQWKQINLTGEIKTIRFQQGKTGRQIVIVIHPELEKFLRSLHKQRKIVPLSIDDDEAFVFPALAALNVSTLSKLFRGLMARAGIKQRVIRECDASGSGRGVYALSFHSLRHGFVSCLANSGVAEEIRMALAGHATREMGQLYTHLQLQVYQQAISTLPIL